MSNRVEMNGATIEEAIENALKELGASREEVDVIIVREPAKGFLGLGAKDAQVIVSIKKEEIEEDDSEYEDDYEEEDSVVLEEEQEETEPEVVEEETTVDVEMVDAEEETQEYDEEGFNAEAERVAVAFLEEVFEKMHFDISVDVDYEASSENEIYIHLNGAEVGITIGRRGETLDALQYLTNLTLGRKIGMGVKVVLDVENYREKRRDTLVMLAERLEKKVIKSRRSVTLEPMNPYERRIIHATLQNSRQVETYSVGNEPNRMVVIDLKGRRK